MKTVGKQLEEARLAKNWTPELAARETKIKVDRLRDLEADNYSHFTSPTYARGFVRTYARALGLDEYPILRQLDNKLPDDDSANIVTDGGVAYLPETALPPRVAHRDYTGLYIVFGLGVVVSLAIVVVLFQAYRVGELPKYFHNGPDTASSDTNATNTPASAGSGSVARALPLDSNTPPSIAETNPAPVAPVAVPVATADTTHAPTDAGTSSVSPRAMPVNPTQIGSSSEAAIPVVPVAPRALPVDPNAATDPAPAAPLTPPTDTPPETAKVAPRALPVTPADLDAAAQATTPGTTNTLFAANTLPPVNPHPLDTEVTPHSSPTARQSNSGPVVQASAPAVAPESDPIPPVDYSEPKPVAPAPAPESKAGKRLILTASEDSFVRVTSLDSSATDKPLYAAVLHSGQSVGFEGRKFSVNVGIPSAVNINLDGVNYGPHSDREAPETFTVQSHMP